MDSGAPDAFFPGERRAMLGTYEEVSCSEWSGTDGDKLWNGSCLAGENVGLWPETGCSNVGANHSLAQYAVLVNVCFRNATRLSVSCMAQQIGERSLLCGTERDRSLRGGHLSIPEKKEKKKAHYCIPESCQMKLRSFSWTFLSSPSAIWTHCGECEKIEGLKARKGSRSTSGAAIRAEWWLCKKIRFSRGRRNVSAELGAIPKVPRKHHGRQ